MIVGVALRGIDDRVVSLSRPARHGDVIAHCKELGGGNGHVTVHPGPARSDTGRGIVGRMRMLNRWPVGLQINPNTDRPSRLPRQHLYTDSLDEHMGLVAEQVYKSMRDPDLRQLTVRLVSDQFDYAPHPRTGRMVPLVSAWGQWFYAPEVAEPCRARDERCEVRRLWDFCHRNLRYVYDPDEIDFFATARATLEAGGGDCDDFTIVFASMGGLIGFKRLARVISTSEDPDNFVHVYPMLGLDTKDHPSVWVPLDDTVSVSYPGWQYPNIGRFVDYEL